MPYTTAEGPPDMNAIHAFTAPSAPHPPQLNQQTTWPPTFPWARVMQITGWRALPESEDNRQPRTFTEGEIVYPSLKLGKTLAYECRVEALTIQSLQQFMNALVQGFGHDMSNEGIMTVVPYSGFGGGQEWTFSARVLSMEPDPAWQWDVGWKAPFRWPFLLTMRMSDPHFYASGVPFL
jgi:hypothetical protein